METMQLVLTALSLFISLSTVCTLIYGFGKFLSKPHESLEQRVGILEHKCKEVERALIKNEADFHEQDTTNEVLIHSTLALIEFEIQYCLTEKKPMSKDLEKAKEDLHRYLAKK